MADEKKLPIDREYLKENLHTLYDKITEEMDVTVGNVTSDEVISDSADGNIRSLHLFGKGRKSGNLLDLSQVGYSNTSKGITYTVLENGGIKLEGQSTHTAILPLYFKNGGYIVWANFEDADTAFFNVEQKAYAQLLGPVEGVSLRLYRNSKDNFITVYDTLVEVPPYNYRVSIVIAPGATVNTTIYPMLSTNDFYEPYGLILSEGKVETQNEDGTKTSSINASEILSSDFCGVGDIKDELIVNSDGSGKFIKRVRKVALEPSKITKSSATTYDGFLYNKANIPFKYKVGNAICNCLIYGWKNTDNIGLFGYDDTNIWWSWSETGKTTLDDMKGYATSNPITFILELATPTITDLTPSQVSALLSLKTFKDHVTITSDSEYELGYYMDNEVGQSLADLDGKIKEITLSIENENYYKPGDKYIGGYYDRTTVTGYAVNNGTTFNFTIILPKSCEKVKPVFDFSKLIMRQMENHLCSEGVWAGTTIKNISYEKSKDGRILMASINVNEPPTNVVNQDFVFLSKFDIEFEEL